MTGALHLWVIYQRPIDYPIFFVVRRWTVTSDGYQLPDQGLLLAITLDEARSYVPRGLYRQPREPDSDPKIVETWF